MKIAVITDVHANLPALEAALKAIRAEGYDMLFHTGDAIGIGPCPGECLDLLLNTPNVEFVMGNHEAYFVGGPAALERNSMSEGEIAHHLWTHAHLTPSFCSVLLGWPYAVEREFEGVRTTFVHYGLQPSQQGFQPIVKRATAVDLDGLFPSQDAEVIFYGHNHDRSDVNGCARYVNPGSSGCCREAVARYCVATFRRGECHVEQRAVPYDDAELLEAFEQRRVPEREFIYRAFFGERLQVNREDATGKPAL